MKIIDLFEAIDSAYLYHVTTLEAGANILKENMIRGRTWHSYQDLFPGSFDSKDVSGVSLSRNKNFKGVDEKPYAVLFILDWNKLKHRHKIIPIDYFNRNDYDGDEPIISRGEAEEFVLGNIPNLNNYLIGVKFSIHMENLLTNPNFLNKHADAKEKEQAEIIRNNPKYCGKPMQILPQQQNKAVNEGSGRIVVGVNTPPGITIDHMPLMGKRLGFNINRDGYVPTMPVNGKINNVAPKNKDYSAMDTKSKFTGVDLTKWTDGKGKDMAE